ncbi:MAG: diguanylate cyclase [Acidobacteria bacterium]|nr:diguanylate cyclase [Acidobacteriota bacterium]
MRDFQLLLVEDSDADARLITEALREIVEGGLTDPPNMAIRVRRASTLREAQIALREDAFDLILLDLALPDSESLHTYIRLARVSPRTPIVVLWEEPDPAFEARVISEGAQDVLLKDELECRQLVRVIRHAVERHKLRQAAASTEFLDPLSGLYTAAGFAHVAGRDLLLAARFNWPLQVVVIQARGLRAIYDEEGSQVGDLVAIEMGEMLRPVFDEFSVLARLNDEEFAATTLDRPMPEIRRLIERAAEQLATQLPRHTGGHLQWRTGAAQAQAGQTIEQVLAAARLASYESAGAVAHRA